MIFGDGVIFTSGITLAVMISFWVCIAGLVISLVKDRPLGVASFLGAAWGFALLMVAAVVATP